MKKLKLYIKGVVKAIKGEYPHEVIDQLNHLKNVIETDLEQLPLHPFASGLIKRYLPLFGGNWQAVNTLPITVLKQRHAKPFEEYEREQKEAAVDFKGWITSLPEGKEHDISLLNVYHIYPDMVGDDEHSYH